MGNAEPHHQAPVAPVRAAGRPDSGGWSAWLDDPTAVALRLSRVDWAGRLEPNDLQRLVELGHLRRCAAGERILCEGQASQSLFVVLDGVVAVLKGVQTGQGSAVATEAEGQFFRIKELGPGSVFGEMSFIDGHPASATVMAEQPCAVLAIHHSELDADAEGVRLGQRLTAAVATAVIQRMRDLNDRHVTSMQAEIEQARLRVDLARFFTVTMALYGISSAVTRLIHPGLLPSMQMLLSWGFLLLTFAPIAWFAWRQRMPIATFGLTRRNAKKSLKESMLTAGVVIAALVAYAAASRPAGASLFAWGSLSSYSTVETALFFALYPAHCFLQELIGRGVIQGSLARLMPEARPATPVVLTSALFGIYHLYVSLQFALITFVASLLFGWLYRRHGTLIGVTAVHLTVGCASVAVGLN